jgi:hypothetical protein
VTNPELVTALDLDQWSDSLNAQSTLPVLIRRLVLATASVIEIAMRGGEGTRLPGWDGVVKATAEDPHVPAGTSVWELGTSKDPREKAQSDFKARTDDPLDVDPAATTFVAVTSRIWRDRDKWRNARRSDSPWADVRAYDADDLETWLERAPSVHIWISELLGREPRDAKSPERWWATWSSQTHPILSRSFLLAGRDDTRSELREALARSSQVVTVDALSREEALAVICATLVGGSDEVDELAARSLVVSGPGAWERLADSSLGLVLVPTFDNPDVSTALSRGHRVVVPAARVSRPRGVEVKVRPLDQMKAAEALLKTAGFSLSREKADQYAEHASRNLLSLRRTIAVSPVFERPKWSRPPEGSRFAPLLLAGSWRQDAEGDQAAIASLAARPYASIETDVAGWSALEDAPLRRSGQAWHVVSKEDAWDLISQLVTPTDLRRFRDVGIRVLQEPDPGLDLPPERRFMAAVVGEPRTYSLTLRGSIADTLAFLGGYSGDARLVDNTTGQEYADRLVWTITRQLNDDPTGRAWQSLADVLPLLAEASPDRFLDAVETGLTGDDPVLQTMFLDGEAATSFGASSPHFSLVWALETLCWSPDYLGRGAGAMARLAEIDPEPHGRSNPRPAGSLANVFSLYWPQTSAPLQRRIAVLDGLRRRSPAAAWPLLHAILLATGIGFPTHRPRWRPWAQGRTDVVDPVEVAAGTTEIVTRLLEDAGTSDERWSDLISHLDSVSTSDRDRILAALETLDPDRLGDPGKTSVWRSLAKLTGRHRQFANSDWAMPEAVVNRVEDIAGHFAPTSLADLYTDLFDHRARLPGLEPRDYEAYEDALRTARRDAARAVVEDGGVTELLVLGSAAKLPVAVGWAAAEAWGDQIARELLPLLGTEGWEGEVARGYAGGRLDADGLDWVERQLRRSDVTWTSLQQAGLLLAVPRQGLRLLAILKRMPSQVQETFWQRMNPFYAEPAARPVIARALIERRRPWAAITVLANALSTSIHAAEPLDASFVELALDRAVTGPTDDGQQAASLAWEVEQLLDYLERAGSDVETRARLEFQLMPLLQHTRPARALGQALQEHPELFVEIIRLVYRGDDDAADEPVPPEQKALAEVGFSALRSWRMPPGLRADGTIDVRQLRTWVSEARRLLAESGRRAVGDIVIGEVLAYLPAEDDGLWPPSPVRDLVEDLASTELETGLRTGKFNSRGIVTRGPLSGGEQERVLARQFRRWAERVADQWPRTGALLRGLADDYDAWAQRGEDLTETPWDLGNYSTLNRLSRISEDQWGLVTVRQAALAGVSETSLRRLATDSVQVLELVADGVYRLAGAPEPDQLSLRAAWLQLAPEILAWKRTPNQGVISHRSAAALYGLGHLPADVHDFTVPGRRQSPQPDIRLYQGRVNRTEWLKIHGMPVTRPSRIAADLLDDEEDPEAVAYVIADAIRSTYDYPGTFADTLGPYAARFGLRPGDGLALLKWLLDLVGDPETERWLKEARAHIAPSSSNKSQQAPPHPQGGNRLP